MSFDEWFTEKIGVFTGIKLFPKEDLKMAYEQGWKDRQKLDAEIAKKKYTDKCSTHYQMASLGIAQSIREKD